MRRLTGRISSVLFVVYGFWLQSPANMIRAAAPAARPRVFLVPRQAEVIEKKAAVDDNDPIVWIKRGGAVTAKVNAGLFFVDAGGTLEITGNSFKVIVAEGGTLTSLDGNVVHVHHAKGARIGKISANVDHVTVHDNVVIQQSKPFPLTGTVRREDGKTAAGVKVHAYTLGKDFLATRTTDAQGHFTFTTDVEVSALVADLSPIWDDEKRLGRSDTSFELRQRFSPLQGWGTAIAHGPWTEKSTVDLRPPERAKIKMEEFRSLPTGHANQPVYPELRFSPDATYLAVLMPEIDREKAETQLWEVRSGKRVGRFPLKAARQTPGSEWAAFSATGKQLAVLGPHNVQIYGLPDGKSIQEIPFQPGENHSVALSPGGELLAVGGDKEIAIWDVGRKQVVRRLKGHEAGTTRLAFAPDGKSLLSGGQIIIMQPMFTIHTADKLRLWNLATGKELDTPPGQEGRLHFSATGQILSAGVTHLMSVESNTFTQRAEEFVSLADLSSRRELLRLKGKGGNAAFTTDARLIVTAGRGGVVRFWEVRTGQEVLAVPVPVDWTASLALSPDGKMLVTGRGDGSLRIWDLRWDRLRVPEEPLTFTETEGDQTWKDLSGDAAIAYRAVWRLSRQADPALRFLKERLQSAPRQDLPIEKWIADLASPQFKLRQAAARELSKHSRLSESALRAARESKLPLEVHRRIEELLAEVERRRLTLEELSQVRGIAALEWIGTSEARQLLKALAGGWSASMQTQEAAAALQRLSK